MTKPKLGQFCQVSAIATKDKAYGNVRWQSRQLEQSIRAMYIGKRTVYSGYWERQTYQENKWEYPEIEDEPIFARTQQHTVYLFVANERENLFRAFPENVTILEDEK